MIKNVGKKSVFELFPIDKKTIFEVPKYQRAYTWGQKDQEALFNDIIQNNNGYFLGSTIVVNNETDDTKDPIFIVIDGQQRLTTLSILLLSIYCKLTDYKDTLSEEQEADLINLRRELVVKKDNKKCTRLVLQSQNHNNDDFKNLFYDKKLIDENIKDLKNTGNRLIYQAFKRFTNYIENYIDEEKQNDNISDETTILFDLLNKVNSSFFIFIQVETNTDAYMMFESLNNRGVPLTVVDLIKNSLISIADKNKEADDYYEKWTNILSNLSNDYKIEERFLRQYYNAFRYEINKPYKTDGKTQFYFGSVATRSTILNIYEKLIKSDYKKTIDDLTEKSEYYSLFINNENSKNQIESLIEPFSNLDKIQGAPSYILLLYLMSNKEQMNLTDEILAEIINYLVSFFVRRNITDFPNTRNLTKIFMEIIELVRNIKGEKVYYKIVEYLKVNSSSDEEFKNKLKGPLYLDNPDATRFLLCYYEDYYKTNEIYTDLWERDKNKKFVWTIEHIFPEGDNIPQSWVNMIASGDSEKAKEYLTKYAHVLGNLTLTGYNQKLSNMSFEDKKNRKITKSKKDGTKNEIYVGYRNGLKLNEDIVKLDSWHIENIIERTEKLVKFFAERFTLEIK